MEGESKEIEKEENPHPIPLLSSFPLSPPRPIKYPVDPPPPHPFGSLCFFLNPRPAPKQ